MGAQRAAWMIAHRAETAARQRLHFGSSLLDLVKAFEKIPHHHIVSAARRLGVCLCTLRLSLASYRLPRTLGADRVFSRLVVAAIGITAGAVFATFELRIIMQEVVVGTLGAWPLITITLCVDDATLEIAHGCRQTGYTCRCHRPHCGPHSAASGHGGLGQEVGLRGFHSDGGQKCCQGLQDKSPQDCTQRQTAWSRCRWWAQATRPAPQSASGHLQQAYTAAAWGQTCWGQHCGNGAIDWMHHDLWG